MHGGMLRLNPDRLNASERRATRPIPTRIETAARTTGTRPETGDPKAPTRPSTAARTESGEPAAWGVEETPLRAVPTTASETTTATSQPAIVRRGCVAAARARRAVIFGLRRDIESLVSSTFTWCIRCRSTLYIYTV